MNKYIKKGCWFSLMVTFSIVIAGCNLTNSNQAGTRPVNVYMQTKTAGTIYSNPYGLSETTRAAAVDTSLKLTDVSLFVRELRLKSVTEDSLDFHQKNLVVDLPLGQDSVQISTTSVPKGTYDGLSVHIGKPAYADSAKYPQFVAGPSEHDRYSMIISGTYKGQNFTFKVHHDFEFHLPINPPLVISDSTVSVDVNLLVDTSKWFVDPETGQTLDPTSLDALDKIIENIDSSFEAHRREHDMEDSHQNDGHGSNNGSNHNNGGN